MKILLNYLYPKPDPLTKDYEMRRAECDIEFLKRLVDIDGLPYFIRENEKTLFLDGQYTYRQIRKIIKKHGDSM